MNSAHFKEWLTEKVLPNTEDKTVIVIDNAPCHSKQTDESKKANTSWKKKKKIQDWLKNKNIAYGEGDTIPQLLPSEGEGARCTEIV